MEPLTGMIAVSVVSGLVQAWQAENARDSNSDKLKEIERMFSQLVPPQYDISPNDPPQLIAQKLQGVSIDVSSISPQQFKVMGSYAPEAAQYVAEANPTLVQQSAIGQEGRQSQIDALRQFKQIAAGDNPELQAALEKASRDAQVNAQSRTESLMQDEARRGMLGSGKSFAAMLQGNSDSMLRGAEAGRDGALEAYRSKMSAIRDSGTMGRQLASDEFGEQQTNADIINQFNQRTSRNYQEYQNNRANLSNQAQMENLRTNQDISNRNTAQGNEFAVINQRNRNANSQQEYMNQRDERNYQNDIAQSQAKWGADEKQRQNSLKSQTYNDQIQRANGMAGFANQGMQQNIQNAADRNAAVSGVGSSISGYMANQHNNNFLKEQNAANQAAEDARERRRLASNESIMNKYASFQK